MRDQRMMLLGVLTALGIGDLAEIQANAILPTRRSREDELQGDGDLPHPLPRLPAGLQARRRRQTVIKKRKKAAEKGDGEDKKANVNAAVQMHVRRNIHDK